VARSSVKVRKREVRRKNLAGVYPGASRKWWREGGGVPDLPLSETAPFLSFLRTKQFSNENLTSQRKEERWTVTGKMCPSLGVSKGHSVFPAVFCVSLGPGQSCVE
jgi:hypothetical protein